MVILPLLSTLASGWPFGFASAPYDPEWALRYPRRAAWMAVAGPASNLVLVVLSIVAIRVGVLAGVFYAPDSAGFGEMIGTDAGGIWPGLAAFISIAFSMNLMLACLNMFPLPPLDGSAAITLLMSESTANKYQQMLWRTPMFGMVGMLVAWRMFDVIFYPIFWVVVAVIYPDAAYG